jgi:cytochrome d ubiquinol oxidase subunit II
MHFDLNTIWFVLVGVLFTGYAMLDGFDLGIGALHLFTNKDDERRLMLNAIGPVWDGNEVWLVTGGGALFAAFPNVYATVFSGFYLALYLLLAALIFRAVAIEFRSKRPNAGGGRRGTSDLPAAAYCPACSSASRSATSRGESRLMPHGEFAGTFLGLLKPYPLLVGVTTVALFMMHGAIYGVMKTEGALHDKLRRWAMNSIIFFVICAATLTMATLLYVPHMAARVRDNPWLFSLALANMLAIANIPREFHPWQRRQGVSVVVRRHVSLMALFALERFPNMVTACRNPENSLNIYNAASSAKTLGIMLVIACIGVPVVLAYTVCIYWIFRGKVKIGPDELLKICHRDTEAQSWKNFSLRLCASVAKTYSTRASPLPLTTSPISHALCFCARMNFKTSFAFSAETIATMPMPMLKT